MTMELLKSFEGSLAFTLAFGLFIGGFLHYINLGLLKLNAKSLWRTILGTWLILGLVHCFLGDSFFSTKGFQYAFAIITVLGLISAFKTYRNKK